MCTRHYSYSFIYLWLCWVFISVRGLSLVVASGGHSSSRCAGLSLSRPLLLRSTGSRRAGSVIVAHGPSCSAVCGIFPDQGSNLWPLHWQADSQPLCHQGNPPILILLTFPDLECLPPGSSGQNLPRHFSKAGIWLSLTWDHLALPARGQAVSSYPRAAPSLNTLPGWWLICRTLITTHAFSFFAAKLAGPSSP